MDLKDVKKITVNVPDTLHELHPELNLIMNTTNKIIIKYLEKQIYNTTISNSNKEKINTLFIQNKQLILEPL